MHVPPALTVFKCASFEGFFCILSGQKRGGIFMITRWKRFVISCAKRSLLRIRCAATDCSSSNVLQATAAVSLDLTVNHCLNFPQNMTLCSFHTFLPLFSAAVAAPLTCIVMAEHRAPFCRYLVYVCVYVCECWTLLRRSTARWQQCFIFIPANTDALGPWRSVEPVTL